MIADEHQKEKVRIFLNSKKDECEQQIRKYKIKNKKIKAIYYTLLVSSILGQAAVSVAAVVVVAIPPLILAPILWSTTVGTAISSQFNLRNQKSCNRK